MNISLSAFSKKLASEVASWISSVSEAKDWAGSNTAFPVAAGQFQRWHDDPDVHTFIGKHNGAALAYGELWVDREEREIELARILVHPEHRGQGTGRVFVRSLADHAGDFRTSNFSFIIRVVPENIAAIRCYQAAGFDLLSEDEQREFNGGQPRKYLWLDYAR